MWGGLPGDGARVLRQAGATHAVRDVIGVQRDGVTALALLQAGRLCLRGRGVRLGLKTLPCLAKGTILHWEFAHFGVFERWRKWGRHRRSGIWTALGPDGRV